MVRRVRHKLVILGHQFITQTFDVAFRLPSIFVVNKLFYPVSISPWYFPFGANWLGAANLKDLKNTNLINYLLRSLFREIQICFSISDTGTGEISIILRSCNFFFIIETYAFLPLHNQFALSLPCRCFSSCRSCTFCVLEKSFHCAPL